MGSRGNFPVLECPELLCPGAALLDCEERDDAVPVPICRLRETGKAPLDLELRDGLPVDTEL